jgi:hypothetical protein
MPLRRALVPIPILGLDTNADPKSAPPGTLDLAENVFWKRKGNAPGWELRKRFGVTARPATIIQGGTIGSGRKLANFNNEQLIIDKTGLFSWDAQSSKWVQIASTPSIPLCTLTAEPVSATRFSALDVCDCAYGGGYICIVSGQGPNQPSHVTVVSLATGARVLDTNLAWSVTTGIQEIRVVALASVFMILASFQTGNLLASKTIAFATPTTVSAEVSVSATAARSGTGPFWDMQRAGSNDWAMVGLQTTTPNTTIIRWNSNQTSGGTSNSANVADQGLSWLTWDYSDGSGYLSYIGSAVGLKTFTVTATTAAISATTVNDAAVVSCDCICGYRTGSTNNIFVSRAISPSANIRLDRSLGGAVAVYQRGLCAMGKPFLKNGRYFLPCVFDNIDTPIPTAGVQIDQRAYFILDVTSTTAFTGVVVGKAFFGEALGQPQRSTSGTVVIGAATAFADIDSNRTAIVLRRAASDSYVQGSPALIDGKIRDVWLCTFDFSFPAASPAATAGENLFLPGGAVKEYDGSTVAEAGFHVVPEYPTTTVAAGGYGATVPGSVGVCIVWKYIDNRGQTRRSAPSQAQFATTTGANGITSVSCQTYRLSERGTQVAIEVYFTAVNGSVFYLVGQVGNDPTADTVTFTVPASLNSAAGVALAQQQAQLYTSDGSLAHEPLPPARLMAAWRGRIFLAGTEDSTDLWVSDEWFSGEGVYFSSANVISMEKEGGAITALAEMDDRLIIFKRSALYELVGSGPTASGGGNFDQPARITATVGTIIPESVVKTPQGLMFQSLRGFYLLPIGGGLPIRLRGVETFENITTTGAVVMENFEQVRWVCSTGTVLVYHFGILDDQGVGRWTTFTNFFAVDCAVFGGKFVYLISSGFVNEESSGWDDNGSAIAVQARVAWLSPAGLFGDVRLWSMIPTLDVFTGFTLNLNYEVDFVAGAAQSTSLVISATNSPSLELKPARQDASAYRFTFAETSTTQGFRLSGFTLELGSEGALKRTAPTSRFT